MTPYKKLFVVGCPRSGTTWLAHMIKLHPEVIAAWSESHAYPLVYDPFTYLPLWNFQQRIRASRWVIRQYGLPALLAGITPEVIWQSIKRSYRAYQRSGEVGLHLFVPYNTLHELMQKAAFHETYDYLARAKYLIADIFNHFFYQADGTEKHTFLEKTPMHLRYLDIILQQFPEAKAIELIRDGRDVCASHLNLKATKKWAKQKTSAGVIEQWKRCIEMGQRFKAQPALSNRIYTLHYEQLRTQPTTELQKIFEFAELPSTLLETDAIIQKTDIHKRKHRGKGQHVFKGAIGDWGSVLSEYEIRLVKSRAGSTLAALGYTW